MKKITFFIMLLCCFTVWQAFGQWRSSLYPANWTPPGSKKSFYNDAFLQDYSYAGYHLGEVSLPSSVSGPTFDVTQSPYNADKTGSTDVTAKIQQAINDAVAAGGGTVYLPAGTYRVSPGSRNYCFRISGSKVVLKGAGAGATFIYNDSNQMRGKSVILIAPASGSGWNAEGNNSTKITSDLNGPTRVIPLANASNFKVGDKVIVRNTATAAWADEHKEPEWTSSTDLNRLRGIIHYREVTAVNSPANTITIDAPIRYALKTRDNARVYLAPAMLSEVGLRDFSLGNKEITSTSGWLDPGDGKDLNNNGHYVGRVAEQAHNSFLISMDNTRDSWIQQVKSYNPAANGGKSHMLSNGILLDECRGVTLDGVYMGYAQYGGGGGNGYGYRIQSNDVLIKNSTAELTRHGFVMSHMYSHGNVFHKITDKTSGYCTASPSDDPSYMKTGSKGSDFHMYFSASCLIDQATMENSLYSIVHRKGVGQNHNTVTAHSTVWNIKGNSNLNYVVATSQTRYGYIIGTSGSSSAVKYQLDDYEAHRYDVDGVRTAPLDIVQGVGQGTSLEPQSLYLDQLSKRMGNGGGSSGGTGMNAADDVYTENGIVFNTPELKVENGTRIRKSYLKFNLSMH